MKATLCLFAFCYSIGFSQDVAFVIKEKDLIPEGIAFDSISDRFFVSSTYKRKIVEIDRRTGKYRDFIKEKQDGICGVIGMHVDGKRRVLWAVTATMGMGMPAKDIGDDDHYTGVYKYDLRTGRLIKKYVLEDASGHFLNDITVLRDGTVFITDTQGKSIYTINPDDDKLSLFHTFQESFFPNGIVHTPDEKFLIVAVYKQAPHGLLRMSVADKSYQVVQLPEGESVGADGLCWYKGNVVAIQPQHQQRVLARYSFGPDYTTATVKTIVADHAGFVQPTTGVVAGEDLYFIATSQLQLFRRLFAEHKDAYPPGNLTDSIIMKVRLQ